jgi:hypothetical protein
MISSFQFCHQCDLPGQPLLALKYVAQCHLQYGLGRSITATHIRASGRPMLRRSLLVRNVKKPDAFWLCLQAHGRRIIFPATCLTNVPVRTSVGSEKSVPEKFNHREIAASVQMVDEVKLLLAPEPSEAYEGRSFGMVLLVKIYVGGKRRRASSNHYEEQIERKNKEHPTCDENCRDEKVGRVVSFVATISGGHQMVLGIVCMMKSDVVPVENAAYSMMAEAVME